jgi:hypothetical protein
MDWLNMSANLLYVSENEAEVRRGRKFSFGSWPLEWEWDRWDAPLKIEEYPQFTLYAHESFVSPWKTVVVSGRALHGWGQHVAGRLGSPVKKAWSPHSG